MMSTLKRPVLWIGALVLVVLVCLYTGVFYSAGEQQPVSPTPQLTVKAVKKAASDLTRLNAPTASTAQAQPEGTTVIHIRDLDRYLDSLPTVGGDAYERAAMHDWMNTWGYNKGRENEYQHYSEETLRQLAEGGDIHAMVEYGYEMMRRPGGMPLGEEWFINAMVHGSLDAFLHMSIFVRRHMEHAETPEQMRGHALESLAWYEAAALRGNKELGLTGSTNFIRSNDIRLSPQDVQWLQARAQEIYRDLVARRAAAGLDEFDNSVPPVVDAYFERLSGLMEREKLGLPPL